MPRILTIRQDRTDRSSRYIQSIQKILKKKADEERQFQVEIQKRLDYLKTFSKGSDKTVRPHLEEIINAFERVNRYQNQVVTNLEDTAGSWKDLRAGPWKELKLGLTLLFQELNRYRLTSIEQAQAVVVLFDTFDFDWGKSKDHLTLIKKFRSDIMESETMKYINDLEKKGMNLLDQLLF